MAAPVEPKKYVFKNRAEKAIDRLIDNDKELTQSALNTVYICPNRLPY